MLAHESSVEQNHLCNFGREYYKEHFLEIIFNLDQWFRRCNKDNDIKIFLIYSSGACTMR